MAYAVQTNDNLVQPLPEALVRKVQAAEDLKSGEAVYLNSSGYAALADSDAVATNYCFGVVVHDTLSGKLADIVTLGPITMCTGATPGALVYTNGTAGGSAETAGTKVCVIGVALNATTVYVRPYMTSFA